MIEDSRGLKHDLEQIWQAGLDAANVIGLIQARIQIQDHVLQIGSNVFRLDELDRIIVIGAGKCAGWMAQAIESFSELQPRLCGRVHVVEGDQARLTRIETVFARPRMHNQPTATTVEETARTVGFLNEAKSNDLVLFLISGGASALMELPSAGVSLNQILEVSSALFKAGASIEEINRVRARLSQVKGGGLIAGLRAQHAVSMVLCDIPSGQLELVGSGLTTPFANEDGVVQEIVQKFNVESILPEAGFASSSESVEPLSSLTPLLVGLGGPETAATGALRCAEALGYECSSESRSDSVQATAQWVLDQIELLKSRYRTSGCPQCLVSVGEPVVEIEGQAGLGGRNTHLVLEVLTRAMKSGDGREGDFLAGVAFASIATDGEDGVAPCSGAWFDFDRVTLLSSSSEWTAAGRALREFDSYRFLQKLGCTLASSPPQTNVCDLRILLVNG